jgi:DnaJ-class molecular chaperone
VLPDQLRRARCEACNGTGLISSETGNPIQNSEAWRSDTVQCAYCDGGGVALDQEQGE